MATTIDTTQKLLPSFKIYKEIEGQPFLYIYGKFSKKSIPILKEKVPEYTILPQPLQKIIPMNPNEGVYMIAYSDNKSAVFLKDFKENTKENCLFLSKLLEKSLNLPLHSLQLLSIKDFYWPIGTHFYKPLNKKLYKNREDFIHEAQHPQNGILVVGEAVSRNQGWTHGAFESVENAVTKSWIKKYCD